MIDVLLVVRLVMSVTIAIIAYLISRKTGFWPILGITVGETISTLLRLTILTGFHPPTGDTYGWLVLIAQTLRLVGIYGIYLAVKKAEKL